MSVLIMGLKMQKEEALKIAIRDGIASVYLDDGKADYYSVIELPDHGDLIDRDKMKHGFCVECTLYPDRCLGEDCDWGSIYHLDHATVVIPAERSEE